MDYQCFADNCASNPVSYCTCSGVPIVFCLTHSLEHNEIDRLHRIIDIQTCPPSDSLIKIMKINQLKISLKITKRSVISQTFDLIKLVNTLNKAFQDHINKLIINCDQIILRMASQDGITRVFSHDLFMSKLVANQIQTCLKEWKDGITKKIWKLKDLIEETLDFSELNLFDPVDNEIIFFRHNTKEMISLNLNSFETQIKEQNILPGDINWFISICEIPNKSKFCFGNITGLTFLIDQDKNIRLLPDGKPNWGLVSKYHKNFVYAIGGENKLAEKYNLRENIWESCALIPFNYNFYGSRCAILGNKIVIVGFYFRKVIIYDIIQNTYLEMTGISLGLNVDKFTFTGKNRVYIGEHNKKFYESAENDLTSWTCISKTNPVIGNYQISYCCMINESVLFMNYSNLYEFNLSTKEIKQIKGL